MYLKAEKNITITARSSIHGSQIITRNESLVLSLVIIEILSDFDFQISIYDL